MFKKLICFLLWHDAYLKDGKDGFVCKRCGKKYLIG
ncbi:Uncharacterised protein [[Flavobacterium] thermophilum]|nr:Uncharacterised protein [[Flavobacterium] thermophilum]